jgi:hypothetical protein
MRNSFMISVILVVALMASACSDSGDSAEIASLDTDSANTSEDDSNGDVDTEAESEAAMLAFTQCLRDQGIDVDDPTMDADGNMQLPPINIEVPDVVTDPDELPDMSEFEDMIAPCEEHLEGVVSTFSSADTTEIEDMLLAYAECMRDNGVDMPDPDFSSSGGVIDLGAIGGEDFEAAEAVCSPLLGDLGFSG